MPSFSKILYSGPLWNTWIKRITFGIALGDTQPWHLRAWGLKQFAEHANKDGVGIFMKSGCTKQCFTCNDGTMPNSFLLFSAFSSSPGNMLTRKRPTAQWKSTLVEVHNLWHPLGTKEKNSRLKPWKILAVSVDNTQVAWTAYWSKYVRMPTMFLILYSTKACSLSTLSVLSKTLKGAVGIFFARIRNSLRSSIWLCSRSLWLFLRRSPLGHFLLNLGFWICIADVWIRIRIQHKGFFC